MIQMRCRLISIGTKPCSSFRQGKRRSRSIDEDVLDYFKNEGAGYQRRINAVLRSYMQQKKDKKPKKRA